MLLLTILLFLIAVLDPALAEEELEDEEEEITGSGIPPKLQQEIIDKHNEIRRNVMPPAANMLKMVWNEAIGERARKWAEECKLQMSPRERRDMNDTFCGEIVFQANYVNSWSEVLEFWHEKKANFKYGIGAIDPKLNIYPYTQLIWYNSYQVGCAATICPDTTYSYFYVCQYCPGGNMQEQIATPYKEGQSCGDCPMNCEDKLCTNPCKYKNISKGCKTLKKLFSCKHAMVKKNCQASCSCKKSIS